MALVQGNDGNLYGTTASGGTNGVNCQSGGCGTVFKITLTGALTTLYRFTGGTDGSFPAAGLVQGTDGNFYGTTYLGQGGANNFGTVFKITPSGSLTTLYSFTGGDGRRESLCCASAGPGREFLRHDRGGR